jgi:isoleucyl-tRNA synthetase
VQVLQKLSPEERLGLTPVELRSKARKFALATVESQKAGFKRFGVWADWDEPYATLSHEYEAAQLGVFGKVCPLQLTPCGSSRPW